MITILESDIKFLNILSTNTAYGLIWNAVYNNTKIVVKMIQLKSGDVYYDKDTKQYIGKNGEITTDVYYNNNNNIPYLHSKFKHRRSMTIDDFLLEVESGILFSSINLGPKIYGFGISKKFSIHYGFIIMQKLDCSIKDLYIQNNYTISNKDENKIIKTINKLHNTYNMIHGDLKPSNMGIIFENSAISKVLFIDFQKVKYKKNYNKEEWDIRQSREIENFKKHIQLNILDK
jgi:signal peptidase I